jgi:hypothetical protein
MTDYFRKLEQSEAINNFTVYEGTYAYHTVLHFHTMDRTSLQKKFADKKHSCTRTMHESIATNIYAP